MAFITNRIISYLVAIICFFSSLFGIPDAEKPIAKQYEIVGSGSCDVGNGKVSIHDPSIIQDENGTYYIFGSHGCAAKSDDMINWTSFACGVNDNNRMLVPEGNTLRETLSEPLSWTDAYQQVNNYDPSQWQTNIWAADVIYNEKIGKYCYYASCSVWGTTGSVIWFATSDNIEGPYEYEDAVVYSGFNNKTNNDKFYSRTDSLHYSFTNISKLFKNGSLKLKEIENALWFDENGEYNHTVYPNCIDPALFYDADGRLWMAYGSYYGGTYIMPIVEKTGLPDYKYMRNHEGYDIYFGKKIVSTTFANELSGEGAYIEYDKSSGYYYLFVSYNGLHALGGYNIREYRSKNPDGPFADVMNNDALDLINTGAKLFGNYKLDCLSTAYLASGHSSCLTTDDGKMFQVYHTRFNVGHDGYETRVHQMARTENGWAVVLPFEYQGETINETGYSVSEICGEYEFINHGTISNGCTDWANVNDIIAPTQSITLNADGTISGLKVYESIKENTNVSSRNVTGSWSVKDGTAYITFIIDDVTYEGVFCKQADESKEKTEKIVFSAMGNNNECIWGVKQCH
ncbi:MAG: glycoside hydrolase family 43 protein [Clostridia bacterium]|nr:glycoside hydrolase family 43 protein [Clostridia bacterium]